MAGVFFFICTVFFSLICQVFIFSEPWGFLFLPSVVLTHCSTSEKPDTKLSDICAACAQISPEFTPATASAHLPDLQLSLHPAYSVTCTLEVTLPGKILLLSGGVVWTTSTGLAADSTLRDVAYYANALIREHLRWLKLES